MDDFALADELLYPVRCEGSRRQLRTIRTAPVLHDKVVDAPDMPKAVKEILGHLIKLCAFYVEKNYILEYNKTIINILKCSRPLLFLNLHRL